jgi:Subtilase family
MNANAYRAEKKADEWFDRLRKEVFPLLPKRTTTKPSRNVRIAILDSGIDSTDSYIRWEKKKGRVKYRNFVGGESSEPSRDAVGHGTHTATLLLTVAQNADLFVGRITPDGKQWKSQEIVDASDHNSIMPIS